MTPLHAARVLLLLAGWLLAGSLAVANESPEYRVKAGFLYNFIVFTTWPEDTGPMLPVCVYGENPFGDELRVIDGKVVAGRRLLLRYPSTRDELDGCRVVFIPAAITSATASLVAARIGEPVLFISDAPGTMDDGAIIRMDVVRRKVVFEVDLAAAQRSRLSLSARLLQLATRVRQ